VPPHKITGAGRLTTELRDAGGPRHILAHSIMHAGTQDGALHQTSIVASTCGMFSPVLVRRSALARHQDVPVVDRGFYCGSPTVQISAVPKWVDYWKGQKPSSRWRIAMGELLLIFG